MGSIVDPHTALGQIDINQDINPATASSVQQAQ